jgi:hypothetical protein
VLAGRAVGKMGCGTALTLKMVSSTVPALTPGMSVTSTECEAPPLGRVARKLMRSRDRSVLNFHRCCRGRGAQS